MDPTKEWKEILHNHLNFYTTDRESLRYPSLPIQQSLWIAIDQFRTKYPNYFNTFYRKWCLSDLLAMKGDYDAAYKALPPISAEKKNSFFTNWRLNLKVLAKEKCVASDLLSLFRKKITPFGRRNLELVETYLDVLLDSWAFDNGIDLLTYIAKKYSNLRTEVQYLQGLGYAIQFHEPIYRFHEISEFADITHKLTREAENTVREEQGIVQVGEGWVAETQLYYKLRDWLTEYSGVIQHARPSWLGKQHLDIYLPELALAIEYQGKQHDEPIEYFGGEQAFSEIQKRDKRKQRLCKRNKITLLYVREGYDFEELKSEIRTLIEERQLLSKE
jgi:hypothetical protein